MKRSSQASLTDLFNKMSKVSKPPESSKEKQQQVDDRQDQVPITSTSSCCQHEIPKGIYSILFDLEFDNNSLNKILIVFAEFW